MSANPHARSVPVILLITVVVFLAIYFTFLAVLPAAGVNHQSAVYYSGIPAILGGFGLGAWLVNRAM